MDEVIQKALKEVQTKARASVPWKLDEPWKQDVYNFLDGGWRANAGIDGDETIERLAIYSWNIDFMLPFPDSRMAKAIEHLRSLVESGPDQESTATVIYLQECVESDIKLIAGHPWIRETFAVTDLDISNWQSGHYGTISLVDRRLPVLSCFRIHYSQTMMERDVLIVDVRIDGKTIRMCNTHLESMAFEPPRRIPQMKLVAGKMRESGIDGAIAAGDFNAIQDFDRRLHVDNGLNDVYLELGLSEEDSKGHTWGQQASTKLRQQFGTTRMDKVYFCGQVESQSFQIFGMDVVVDDQREQEQIVALGFDKPWITDHLGVKAVFQVSSTKLSL